MKKRKLIIFLSVMIVTLLIIGFGVYHYLFAPDELVNTQLEEQFSKEFFDFSDLDLDALTTDDAAGTTSNEDNESSNSSETTTSETITTEVNSSNSSNESTAPKSTTAPTNNTPVQEPTNNTNEPNNKTTVENIRNEYMPKFKVLETKAIERLDSLFNTAYEEYKSKKIGKAELAKKYVQAGEKLQGGVDGVFYDLLAEMESELKDHQLPTDLVKEAESAYKNTIKEKKAQFLVKLKS